MHRAKIVHAFFYVSTGGRRPVREWLMALSQDDRKAIGEDIATLEYCWPVGMPKCAAIVGVKGLFETRSSLDHGRIARIFFMIQEGRMILLHGFEKKTQKTPQKDIDLAVARMKDVVRHAH
jgi:phage-related protein